MSNLSVMPSPSTSLRKPSCGLIAATMSCAKKRSDGASFWSLSPIPSVPTEKLTLPSAVAMFSAGAERTRSRPNAYAPLTCTAPSGSTGTRMPTAAVDVNVNCTLVSPIAFVWLKVRSSAALMRLGGPGLICSVPRTPGGPFSVSVGLAPRSGSSWVTKPLAGAVVGAVNERSIMLPTSSATRPSAVWPSAISSAVAAPSSWASLSAS